MSTAAAQEIPPIELVYEDGEPMESRWHRAKMELLTPSTNMFWRDRSDYFTGGNMFVYFSLEQARKRDYRGPDYFVVTGVDGQRDRKAWVVWEEGGRYPDLIVELLSPTTQGEDLGTKKDLYERVFRTPEYFCFDPDSRMLLGWRLTGGRYEPIAEREDGRIRSQVLGCSLGLWEGSFDRVPGTWVRFWDERGGLIPSPWEHAEAAVKAAEAAVKAAEAAVKAAEAAKMDAEAAKMDAGAERARADVAQLAGRIVAVYYRAGLESAVADLRQPGTGSPATLLDAIDAIDSQVAQALRTASQ